MKAFLRSDFGQRLIAWFAANWIRFVFRTTRWTMLGNHNTEKLIAANRVFIACFWHSRLAPAPKIWGTRAPLAVLISPHGDGRIIALTIARLGFSIIEGSTYRDPMKALRGLVSTLKAGTCVAITPDGPRGPRMRAAIGVVAAAELAGAPIVPVAYSTTSGIIIRRSWDRFLLPLPFGRGVARFGAPIEVPQRLDRDAREAMRKLVEDRLNEITRDCDIACGREPTEPEPERGPDAGL